MDDVSTPAPRRTFAWIMAHADELADGLESADPADGTWTETTPPEILERRAAWMRHHGRPPYMHS